MSAHSTALRREREASERPEVLSRPESGKIALGIDRNWSCARFRERGRMHCSSVAVGCAAENASTPGGAALTSCRRSIRHLLWRRRLTAMASLRTPRGLTCRACADAFRTTAQQRAHFRSSRHAANARRVATGEPPLGVDEYTELVHELQAMEAAAAREQHVRVQCRPCRKSFASHGAMQQHLRCAKHPTTANTHHNTPCQLAMCLTSRLACLAEMPPSELPRHAT